MLRITIINSYRNFDISQDDIIKLNDNERKIEFSQGLMHSLLPEGAIIVLFELARNIGYNAAYDIIKYSILRFFSYIQEKFPARANPTKIVFRHCGKERSCELPFELTEEQKDRIVDVTIEYLINVNDD